MGKKSEEVTRLHRGCALASDWRDRRLHKCRYWESPMSKSVSVISRLWWTCTERFGLPGSNCGQTCYTSAVSKVL